MSGSQRFVFIISILNIIVGALIIVLGVATIFAGNEAAEEQAWTIIIGGFAIALMGLFEIIGGVLGIRAAKDAMKSGLFYIMSLLTLIFNVVGIVASIVATGFNPTVLCSLVMPLLMFYCARKIKIQGFSCADSVMLLTM